MLRKDRDQSASCDGIGELFSISLGRDGRRLIVLRRFAGISLTRDPGG